ncbi:hypothetical protein ABFA25_13380 [Mycobacterium lepromatosis]|uniref:hypothetical protein n=1 Tax=Mycobacterium lepromatosis TaxID=480418 RepID=UPI003D802AD9
MTNAKKCLTGSTTYVLKLVDGSGGYGIVVGPDASEQELAAASKKNLAKIPEAGSRNQ